MTMSQSSMHPAPQRHRIGMLPLMAGLVVPPAAWVLQFTVNYALSSYSCYPGSVPRTSVLPGWGGVWAGVLTVNLVALVIAIGTTFLSYRNWHVTRNEHPGTEDDLVETGEGRTRFIGLAGAASGVGFTVAIIFDLIVILGVPQCSG